MSKCLVSSCKALVNLSRAFLKVIKMKSICAGKRSWVPMLVCLCVGSKASMLWNGRLLLRQGRGSIYIYIYNYILQSYWQQTTDKFMWKLQTKQVKECLSILNVFFY